MPGEPKRILELALESLLRQKVQIDAEIAELTSELKKGSGSQARTASPAGAAKVKKAAGRKRARFSRAERERRAARMKAYWANWRKEKGR